MGKRMKGVFTKLIMLATGIVILTGVTGCATTTKGFPAINYDSKLVESGKQAINDWGVVQGRTYSVTFKDGIYTADINGDIQKVKLPDNNKEEEVSITFTEDANSKVQKIVNLSMARITAYVKGSEILKDKEQILQKLGKIETKIAKMDDTPALYKEGTMYIGRSYLDIVCEWMICHELIHAIADITNGGVENESYAYYQFNEGLTDMITYTLNPEIPEGYISGYAQYYDFIDLYVGCFGEDAIKAYFYGYDELWKTVGRAEFDFWVYSLENIYNNEVAMVSVNNFLNKWAQ